MIGFTHAIRDISQKEAKYLQGMLADVSKNLLCAEDGPANSGARDI